MNIDTAKLVSTIAANKTSIATGAVVGVGAMDATPNLTNTVLEPVVKGIIAILASTLSHLILNLFKKKTNGDPSQNNNLNPQSENNYQ